MQWCNKGYQRPAAEISATAVPYDLDTPLSFVSPHPCVWYADHGRVKQTSDRLIATAEQPVTIIVLTIGPIVGRSLVSILGSREIPFPGSRKKIETQDF